MTKSTLEGKTMKTAILGLLLLLSGCVAVHRHFSPIFPDAHYVACHSYGYCGPNSGSYMVGSTVCYTNDLSTTQPIDNKDSICR